MKQHRSRLITCVIVLFLLFITLTFYLGYTVGTKQTNPHVTTLLNQLEEDYYTKVAIANNIHARAQQLQPFASKEFYFDWKNKNDDVIIAGDALSLYLIEHFKFFDTKNVASLLKTVEKNNAILTLHNKYLQEIITTYDANKNAISALNTLIKEYSDKLALIREATFAITALGTSTQRADYVEWRYRNNLALDAGKRLFTYITEHFNFIHPFFASELLANITKNNERLERDNQWLEQMINVSPKKQV